jgi:hypothetical protein
MKGNRCLVYANIGSIRRDQHTKICLPNMRFIAEKANLLKLVDLMKRYIDVDYIHIQLHLVQFALQMVMKVL